MKNHKVFNGKIFRKISTFLMLKTVKKNGLSLKSVVSMTKKEAGT